MNKFLRLLSVATVLVIGFGAQVNSSSLPADGKRTVTNGFDFPIVFHGKIIGANAYGMTPITHTIKAGESIIIKTGKKDRYILVETVAKAEPDANNMYEGNGVLKFTVDENKPGFIVIKKKS